MGNYEQNQWNEWLSSFFGDEQVRAAQMVAETRIREPGAWFLGPRAENMSLLLSLVIEAILRHGRYRTDYADEFGDPEVIDFEVRTSDAYMNAVTVLRKNSRLLNEALAGSAPIASMRSHGHMLWDQAIPAIVGYVSALPYNQNNVAAEASPVTTAMEIKVCEQLCCMLGYRAIPQKRLEPWGHITCDGSVANIEALWAARNVKFYAVALQEAIKADDRLCSIKDLQVKLPDGGRQKLLDLSKWQLVNLEIDEVLDLPRRIASSFNLPKEELDKILKQFALPQIGMVNFYQRYLSTTDVKAPQAIVPASAHYSWPKAGTMLGLGVDAIVPIELDDKVRMKVENLRAHIEKCKDQHIPVIAVVAVIGTTEEGAVDPLTEILNFRNECREQNFDFAIHCDAAWGGYFRCMRDPTLGIAASPTPEFPMSNHVNQQYEVLNQADSITVDPHKSGYAPYPAGAICYRNSALRNMVSLVAPVVLHDDDEPSVGVFGIEGSKPGAAAAAVFLAHSVIPLTRAGYGKILGQCNFTSKRMYCRFLTMGDRTGESGDNKKSRLYKIAMLQKIPKDDNIEDPYALITKFVDLNNDKLIERLKNCEHEMHFFKELGSDQLILSFAFNFWNKKKNNWNKDVDAANDFNKKIFKRCSITEPPKPNEKLPPLILTTSQFDTNIYGFRFVNQFAEGLGVKISDGQSLRFLISTTMNPWTTVVPEHLYPNGDFLRVIENQLRDVVCSVVDDMG